jgi:hypothetical protein
MILVVKSNLDEIFTECMTSQRDINQRGNNSQFLNGREFDSL